jgi:hypothetical protein
VHHAIPSGRQTSPAKLHGKRIPAGHGLVLVPLPFMHTTCLDMALASLLRYVLKMQSTARML